MKSETLYLNIINHLRDGVYFVDKDRRVQFWNHAAEELTGYTADEIIGKACAETMLNHIDEEGRPLCIVGCPLFSTIVDGEQRTARVFVRHKDGHRIPIIVNIFPIYEEGAIVGAVEVFTRDTPTVYEDNLISTLTNNAMYDEMTGLPNRRYLESFLNYSMDNYARFGKKFAVLMADVDDFSAFNNNYGHELGDTVLKNIGASIRKSIRQSDLFGRWGGEEFLGVYSIAQEEDAALIAEKLRQLIMNTEVVHMGEALGVSVSIGIATVQPDDTAKSIVNRADELMYQSKENGKNRVTAQ
ncbi:sensor domain-containing diguanylate cyclase [Eubacteriales bacterium OttesenSCG-928-N13]|nr:sensor domain-containing diguanylate cyclase [Eubacteriales bacterium OttesenSCG-928-N13]